MSTIRLMMILFLSGCSIIQNDSNNINTQSIYGREIKINGFSVEKLGANGEYWKNDEEISLFINLGKVEKTFGFKNNIDYLNLALIDYDLLKKSKSYKTSAQIKFTNPETNFLNIKLEYRLLSESKIFLNKCTLECYVIEEIFNVPIIKWSGKNYYLIKKNEIIESIQTLTPFSRNIRIFHKKIAT